MRNTATTIPKLAKREATPEPIACETPFRTLFPNALIPYFPPHIPFLPEVRECIRDTKPGTNTTRGGPFTRGEARRILQALQGEYPVLPQLLGQDVLPVARQQPAVEAADRRKQGSGIRWVRDDLQDVALQRQDKEPASLQRVPVVVVVVVVTVSYERSTR